MAQVATAASKQEIGRPVDDFVLNAIGGENTGLQVFLEGKKAAVVVFWSGVCSHCARYDEYLNRFAQRHPEIGMLAVASGKANRWNKSALPSTRGSSRFRFCTILARGLPANGSCSKRLAFF